VDVVVSTDGVPTNATETQIKQTMAQLAAYANFTLPAPAPAPAAADALEIAGSIPEQAEAASASPTVASPSPQTGPASPSTLRIDFAGAFTRELSASKVASSSSTYLRTISFTSEDDGNGDIRAGSAGAYIYPVFEWTSDASQAVTDFDLASGSDPIGTTDAPQCPAGYELIEQDLNQGGGGNYNYLCLGREGGAPVTAVKFLIFDNAFSGWEYDGWQVVDKDLLAGRGTFHVQTYKYVYIGYKKAGSISEQAEAAIPSPTVAAQASAGDEPSVQHTQRVITGDSYYTISGGMQKDLRGRYDRMGASMGCNDKSIYKQSSGGYYLFQPLGTSSWMVSNEGDMKECKNSGFACSSDGCGSNPAGCNGQWSSNTGTNHPDYAECDEAEWCPEAGFKVV
jgi:hypothetical protein